MSNDVFYKGIKSVLGVGSTYDYTDEEVLELARCAKDPLYFIENYIKVEDVDTGKLIQYKPYKYQREMITQIYENRYTTFNFSRQLGKCVHEDETVTIRNKNFNNNEPITMKIGDFYLWNKVKMWYNEQLNNGVVPL